MKRLVRSQSDRMIAGICGGFAQVYDLDPTLVRLVVAALALITGILPMTLFYVIAWLIIPDENQAGSRQGPTSAPPDDQK